MAIHVDNPGPLDPDRQGVFDRLNRVVRSAKADALYDKLHAARNGKIISVDTARFLAPEFHSWSGRIRHTLATVNPAAGYVYDRILRELSRPGKRRRLVITAGGAGSGKTSQVKAPADAADLVFDNQFKDLPRAREILECAITHRWEIEVVYVHRPFPDVVRAVIERSQRTGRWNRLRELLDTHRQAQATILSLWREYRRSVYFHAQFNASQAAAPHHQPKPGSTVRFHTLLPNNPYHLDNDEETRQVIPKILSQAIREGVVCYELARIIGKGVRGWKGQGPQRFGRGA